MSCNGKCNQGRNCTCSNNQIEMFSSLWQWLKDLFYAGIELLGWASLLTLLGLAAGYVLTKARLI
jgi:hypothetical protein